jgi:hypothetical protein
MRRPILAIALLIALTAAAGAQTEGHPVVDNLMNQLLPYIVSGIGLLITTIVGLAVAWLKAKWNIEISQAQSDKVTRALTNAAGGLIQKYGPDAAMKFDAAHPAVALAANDVVARAGSAMKALGIDPQTVAQRVLEKVPQILPVDSAPVAIAVAPPGEQGPPGPAGAKGPPGNVAPIVRKG